MVKELLKNVKGPILDGKGCADSPQFYLYIDSYDKHYPYIGIYGK